MNLLRNLVFCALIARQYFRGLSAGFHRFHAIHLCELLKVLWTAGHWGELEELAMRSVVVQEVGQISCLQILLLSR